MMNPNAEKQFEILRRILEEGRIFFYHRLDSRGLNLIEEIKDELATLKKIIENDNNTSN